MVRKRMGMLALLYILIHMDISVARTPREDIVTVTQHTLSPRARRHADPTVNPSEVLNGNDFPDHMMFTLHLKDKEVTLQLEKHTTPQSIELGDQNGPIYVHPYDKHRQYAVYQDVDFTSTMIVECWQSTDNCILDGKFRVNGFEWKLKHRGMTDDRETYNVTEVIPKINKNSFKGLNPEDDNGQDSKDTMNYVYKMLNAILSGESTNQKAVTSVEPMSRKDEGTPLVRKKRTYTYGCNIIEVAVRADYTVWQYFLMDANGDESEAESQLQQHYEFLLAQVDCRFRSLDDEDICIRIRLEEVIIEKLDDGTQWSLIDLNGNSNANTAIERCKSKGREEGDVDFVICTTRNNLEWPGNPRPEDFRTIVYLRVLCGWPGYTYMGTEDRQDDQDLLIAHVFGLSLSFDSKHDTPAGCNDDDDYIFSTYNDPPDNPPTTDEHPWLFSSCSVNSIKAYLINYDTSCLKTGSVSEDEVISFNHAHRLPGKVYSLDRQCSYAFGNGTNSCKPQSELSIFPIDNICVRGVYCYVNCGCSLRTRVYNGSPCGCKQYCYKNRCILEFNTTLGTDCNSVCDSNTNTCVCDDDFYQVGTGDDAVCVPKIELGNNCSVNGSCKDDNAECVNGTCTCKLGFVDLCGNGCQPLVDVGDNCTSIGICRDESAQCVNGVCKCNGDNSVDCGGTTCLPYKYFNQPCNCSDQCSRINALCNDGKCQCNSTDALNGDGNCETLVDVGDNCTAIGMCRDKSAECVNGVCKCNGDNSVDCGGTTCLPYKCLYKPCNCSDQCSRINALCIDGKCQCNSTDALNGDGNCETQKGNGDNCTKFDVCADIHACCLTDSNTCVCVPPYFDSNGDNVSGGDCILRVDIGDNCTMHEACSDCNAECESGVCTCTNGYTDCGFNNCLADKCIGDSCNCTEQCSHKKGFCENGTCICNSTEYLNDDGNCATQKGNGDNCTKFDVCADIHACCLTDSNTCVCVPPYFDSNGDNVSGGDCILRVDIGDNCTMHEACSDCNAECESGVCTCTNGYTDCGFNNCLADKCIGDSCNCTEQCSHKKGFCENGTCICNSTEYLNDDGNCATQKGNGDNCTKFDVCADIHACCLTDSNTCVCVPPYFDSNGDNVSGGDCILRVDIGDNCTMHEACSDCNAECESGVCTCTNGYTDCGFNNCLADKCIGDSCNCTEQCSHKKGFCENGTCICNSTEYLNDDGNCATQKGNGDNCTKFDVCADIHACCLTDYHTCVCVPPYYDSNGDNVSGGDCILKVAINESCTVDNACADCNAVCDIGNTGVCKCDERFVFSNGTCVPSTDECTDTCTAPDCGANGGQCKNDTDCVDPNAECVIEEGICGKICRCKALYYNEGCNDTCVLRPGDNATCVEDRCNDLCANGTCDDNRCQPGLPLGATCQSANSCALHPKTKCSTYKSLKIVPPPGVTDMRKVCVCDENKDFVEFNGKCECTTTGQTTSRCKDQ